jgi:hypothetical protein
MVKTWQGCTRRHDAGGPSHRDMSQIIVKDNLDRSTLSRVQNTGEARVIRSPHGKFNFEASLKENRQRKDIVFRFLHEQGRTELGV